MNRTRIGWSLGLALGLTSLGGPLPPGVAQESPPPVRAERPPADGMRSVHATRRAAAQAIRQKMQTRITETFAEMPLNHVIDRLAHVGKLTAVIDQGKLTEEGIPTDEPINLEVKDTTIESSLYWILEPLALTWIIEDEVLKITTQTAANERFETRVYNVQHLQDLVREIYKKSSPPAAALSVPVRSGQAQGSFGMSDTIPPLPAAITPAFDTWGTHPRPSPVAPKAFDPLWVLLAIYEHTSGEWQAIDGVGGTLARIDGMLVVRQTRQMHDEIEPLLEALEQVAAGHAPAAIPVRPATYPQAAEQAVLAALARPVEWKFVNKPLDKVMAEVGKQFGITVRFDRVKLAEEGIPTDEPINLVVGDITLASGLDLMLEPLTLTFRPLEGAILITTETHAAETLRPTVYNTADLTAAGVSGRRLIQGLHEGTSGEWVTLHGVGGTLSEPFPGALIVRQTWQVQNEVAQLLAGLRETQAQMPAAATEPADSDAPVTQFYRLQKPGSAAAVQAALTDMVAPGQWTSKEGSGRIHAIGDTLIIRQPPKVQVEVREFLDALYYWDNPPSGGMSHMGGGYYSTPDNPR